MTLGAYAAAAAASFTGVAAALYALPYAFKIRQRRELRTLCKRQRCIVLTYDDGPSSDITPPLLDLLRAHEARATFFLRGDHATGLPQLADRIVREGHEVGCHSGRHYHAWKTPPWKLTADMVEGYRLLAPWLRADAPFRPPFGKPYLPILFRLARQRARLAWWTIDTADVLPSRLDISHTLDAARTAGGGVILMHDRSKLGESHLRHVLALTERLLLWARIEGLAVKRLRDLFSEA